MIWKKSSEAHIFTDTGMTLDTFQRFFEELGEKVKLIVIITANAFLEKGSKEEIKKEKE